MAHERLMSGGWKRGGRTSTSEWASDPVKLLRKIESWL